MVTSDFYKGSAIHPVLRESLVKLPPDEVLAYGAGVLAGWNPPDSIAYAGQPFSGAEALPAFWRGVFDATSTLGIRGAARRDARHFNREYSYPWLRVQSTVALLNRFREWFGECSQYPRVAHQFRSVQRGAISIGGVAAQMAIFCLYDGAATGRYLDEASRIIQQWRPRSGWTVWALETGEAVDILLKEEEDDDVLRPNR